MKKVVSVLMTLLLCFSALAGCGQEQDPKIEESHGETSTSSSDSFQSEELIHSLEDPFATGFPANPKYYPVEEYGDPITNSNFGRDLKSLNDDIYASNGQEVYAYMPPDSSYLEIHFSPSDKAIEERDSETVALEYMAMALLIIQNYPDYLPSYGNTICIYLGELTAMITVGYMDSDPYTSFMSFSQDDSLNKYLDLSYKAVLGDYDISQLTE